LYNQIKQEINGGIYWYQGHVDRVVTGNPQRSHIDLEPLTFSVGGFCFWHYIRLLLGLMAVFQSQDTPEYLLLKNQLPN
jgi:hypothetical protein